MDNRLEVQLRDLVYTQDRIELELGLGLGLGPGLGPLTMG